MLRVASFCPYDEAADQSAAQAQENAVICTVESLATDKIQHNGVFVLILIRQQKQ